MSDDSPFADLPIEEQRRISAALTTACEQWIAASREGADHTEPEDSAA